MTALAMTLALLIGGQDRTEFGSNDTFWLPRKGEAGFFVDVRWKVVRKLPEGLVIHVKGLMSVDGDRVVFAQISEPGPDGKLKVVPGGAPVFVSGLPKRVMDLSGEDQEDALLGLKFIHIGYTGLAPDLADTKKGIIDMSHQAWLDSVEMARKNKEAAEKRRQAEDEAARREKVCEAEFVQVDKTLKALALSMKGLESPDEFGRSQARKGIDRNAAKLVASLKVLEANDAPPAALANLKARVVKAIAQAKMAGATMKESEVGR